MLFLSVTQQLQHIHRILGDSIIIPSPCISCVVLEIADCWISESTVQVAMQVMAPEDVLLTCYFFLFGRIVTKPWPLAMCQQKKMSSFSLAKLHFIAPFHVTFCKKNIVLKMKCSSNSFLYQNAGCQKGSPSGEMYYPPAFGTICLPQVSNSLEDFCKRVRAPKEGGKDWGLFGFCLGRILSLLPLMLEILHQFFWRR